MRPPPRVALLLLHVLLPLRWREAIAGDLEEDWRAAAHPSRVRFWSLTVRSISACTIDRLRARPDRHLRRAQPPSTGDTPMQSLLQDLRYGWRLMWRSPGFTLAAVVTLGLGIGATTAIFSLLNVLTLKPLAYAEPARVAFLLGWDVEEQEIRFNLRMADYLDLQRQARSFESLGAYTYLSANLTGGATPERVQAYRVTANMFELLDVPAAYGRTFTSADLAGGRHDLAVISHGLWQRLFGGDRSIVGRRIVLNGDPHEIVGVMAPRFEFPVFNFKGDIWVPWRPADGERGQAGATTGATVVGRLNDEASYAAAQSELDVLMRAFAQAHPETNRSLGVRLVEMGRLDDEQAGPALTIVVVTVGLVLVLACANVANLLLARGVSRHRELAVRTAIGASRFRISRQLLVEALLLALAGGAAGIGVAMVALRALRASLPEALLTTVPNVTEIGVDRTTLAFSVAVSIASSVLFGLLPAWRAARGNVQTGLQEMGAAGGGHATRRLRTALVVSEVALSTLLLVAAGLLIRSYEGLQRVHPGFAPEGVLTMTVSLPDYKYPDREQLVRFYEDTIDRAARLPGVRAAGFVNVLPFSTYDSSVRLTIDGTAVEPGREPPVAYREASPGYFHAMQIPILEGRGFDARDRADGMPVAIVNRTLAERFLGPGSAVGRRVRLSRAEDAPWITIVGVAGDVLHRQLDVAPRPEIYRALAQAPDARMMLAVRTDGPPENLVAALRAEIAAIDPDQPVYHVKALEALVADSTMPSRTSAALVALFGLLALLLATVGVYGVMAYGVSQQRREFGVRIALGATSHDLLLLIARKGLVMIGAGIAIGVAGALAVSRLLGGILYGVGPADPVTYAAVVVLLGATGLAACGVPAWRASRTEPVSALRME